MDGTAFTPQEKKTLWGCIIAYGGAYVGRHNIAMLLTPLRAAFSLTSAQAGTLVSLFAITYAAGQLINGHMADKLNPRRHILLGLLGSVACNLILGLSASYPVALIAWGLNGAAQSMLWAPVVRITTLNFFGKKRARVSFFLSVSMPAAILLAWLIAGQMDAMGSWRLGALIPAGLMLLAALGSRHLTKGILLLPRPEAEKAHRGGASLLALMIPTGLWLVLLSCVTLGFVRDSILNWGPTILTEMTDFSPAAAARISLVVPLLSILGVLFGRGAFSLAGDNPYRALTAMALAAAAVALALGMWGGAFALLFAVLLSLLCACLKGANPMFSSLIPMLYEGAGRVGAVAGAIDCAFYVGSSLSGVLTGALAMGLGWGAVIHTWWLGCLAVALMAFLGGRQFFASVPREPGSAA